MPWGSPSLAASSRSVVGIADSERILAETRPALIPFAPVSDGAALVAFVLAAEWPEGWLPFAPACAALDGEVRRLEIAEVGLGAGTAESALPFAPVCSSS